MRKEPAETSEQVSQVIFGETFDLLEEKGNWCYVRLHFDSYEGWISKKMASFLKEPETNTPKTKIILNDPIGRILLPGEKTEYLHIPGGSEFIAEDTGFTNGTFFFIFDPVCALHKKEDAINFTDTALKYLNAPYLWGGRTVFGIDCSGFTQIVYKMNGINIPRDAYQQAEIGKTIHFLDDSQPGDLAFFDNQDGKITHTGILLDKSTIIHSSGKVRIDKIDHQGIYNNELNSYTHKLRIIKRLI
jgi:hypothetical protein